MSKFIELPLVSLLVDRNRDKLHIQVPEHEVAIQKLMNVHGAVRVLPVDDPLLGPFEIDSGAEHARLVRKYHRINADNPALKAYPNPESLERFGFKPASGDVHEAPRAAVSDKRKRAGKKKAEK